MRGLREEAYELDMFSKLRHRVSLCSPTPNSAKGLIWPKEPWLCETASDHGYPTAGRADTFMQE
jgi:hypothetical protein